MPERRRVLRHLQSQLDDGRAGASGAALLVRQLGVELTHYNAAFLPARAEN